MKKILLSAFVLALAFSNSKAQDTLKVMPVGNSITAGEHYGYPSISERTGYRKDLYWMLINAGYNVDFVGSKNHGERPEDDPDWYDWNCEAYPGWKAKDIAARVEYILPTYDPDILLVHVGTNGYDWENKPGHVMDMLDMLNSYSVDNNHPMTVFLCKIINRFNGGHAETTQFNNDVADSVSARTGDTIKIIMVDMENGAGLDYSDTPPDSTINPPYEGGDMWGTTYPGVTEDEYHPNDKGNTKMAVKFFEEINKELGGTSYIKANQQPQQFKLNQNYPNPFNPTTDIQFALKRRGHTVLTIYNSLGQQVANLIDKEMKSGTHQVTFDASHFSSGLYFYKLKTNGFSEIKKMLLLK